MITNTQKTKGLTLIKHSIVESLRPLIVEQALGKKLKKDSLFEDLQ